jgi:cytoskeletal protein RodZ
MDFDQDTDDGRRNRTVAFSVLGLVTAGVILGLLVGGLALTAVRTVDTGAEDPPRTSASEQAEQTPSEPESTPTQDETTQEPDAADAMLLANPTAVGTYEQIDLSGRFPDLGAGMTLQVQRREAGGWADFPVTATTQEDGSFATYVQTGQSGVNKFRMLVVETGETTPPVRVDVS